MRFGTNRVGATAPITRTVFWVMVSMVAWELFQGLRVGAAVPTGSWPLSAVDVIFLVLIPALCAFAFIRLFLVLTQSARGTLNVYAALSSPWAWVFWLGICIAMIGHGVHLAGNAIWRQLDPRPSSGRLRRPDRVPGRRASAMPCWAWVSFWSRGDHALRGHGAAQRLSGPGEGPVRARLPGDLRSPGDRHGSRRAPVHRHHRGDVPLLTVAGFLLVPPAEITRDPITAFIVPGSAASCLIVLIWTLVVGGQPTFG